MAMMILCRLCDTRTERCFSGRVLGRHDITYYACTGCGSLQTEPPYWLNDAYADGNLAVEDTGAVRRSLDAQTLIFVVGRLLRLSRSARVVDIGGGNGLLCRLLRDIGFDACVQDSYAVNQLAAGFDDDGRAPDIVCAFEVAEHFANPVEDMKTILGRGATLCVIGTETWHGQGSDWWYIAPQSGQHVFFYTEAGMAHLAGRFGYHYQRIASWHFFSRDPIPRLRGAILWRVLEPRRLRFVRAWLAFTMTSRFTDIDNRTALAAKSAISSASSPRG